MSIKKQISLGILCAVALVITTAALAETKLRESIRLYWAEGSAIESIELFKIYSRTTLDTTLTQGDFLHTYIPAPDRPGVSEWELVATLSPADLVRTNVVWKQLDGTWVTNNLFYYEIPMDAEVRFFAVTASNFWGESDFFEVGRTPAAPDPKRHLSIR
jgi:hypothetical protein